MSERVPRVLVCMCDERGRASRLTCPACDYDDELGQLDGQDGQLDGQDGQVAPWMR